MGGVCCVVRDKSISGYKQYESLENTNPSPLNKQNGQFNLHATALNCHKILIWGDKNVGKSRLLSWLLKDMPHPHAQNVFHEIAYDLPESRKTSMIVCELD